MTTQTPANAEPIFYQNVGDLFEVVAEVEERETGVFDAALNREAATTLANAGYSLKPGADVVAEEADLFEILITVEQKRIGTFRPGLARTTAKALVEAGCSQ
jgi:hypothetical protein